MRMRTGLGTIVLILSSIAGSAVTDADSEPRIATVPSPIGRPSADRTVGGRPRAPVWWHDPEVVLTLELRPAQIAAMEEARARVHARRGQRLGTTRTRGDRLVALALSADREALLALLDEAVEARCTVASTDVTLNREVVALLDPAQLTTLATRYPSILKRPWTLQLDGQPATEPEPGVDVGGADDRSTGDPPSLDE